MNVTHCNGFPRTHAGRVEYYRRRAAEGLELFRDVPATPPTSQSGWSMVCMHCDAKVNKANKKADNSGDKVKGWRKIALTPGCSKNKVSVCPRCDAQWREHVKALGLKPTVRIGYTTWMWAEPPPPVPTKVDRRREERDRLARRSRVFKYPVFTGHGARSSEGD